MKEKNEFNRSQYLALCSAVVLVPALRLFPSASTVTAERAAWLCAPAALPFALAYGAFICRFLEKRRDGESMAELFCRCLGDKVGKGLLLLLSLWLLVYCGFILRSGADRYITTIYSNSAPAVFSVSMGVAALIAALGPLRAAARVAMLVLPVLGATLALILITALFSVDKANLLPVTGRDILPVLEGSWPVAEVLLTVLFLVAFNHRRRQRESISFPAMGVWTGATVIFLCLMSLAVIGNFGPELVSRLSRPFFALVRNLVFFNSLERVEALVVSLWIFPDFLFCTLLLHSAQSCLRLVFSYDPAYKGQRFFDLNDGRWIIWLCGLAAVGCSLFIARDARDINLWSLRIAPIGNLIAAAGMVPAVFAIGKIRKKL